MPITDFDATGRTTVSPGHDPPEYFAGGVVGAYPGSFSDVYWDTDTSGIPSDGVGNDPNEPGVTGLSNAQLTSGLPAGFDPTVWAENPNINGGRPYLIANPPTP